MKNLFLFAVIASLLFTVACSKTELKPSKELTGIEKLKEMAEDNGGLLKKSTNKSNVLIEGQLVEGNLYYYYPIPEDESLKQQIIGLDKLPPLQPEITGTFRMSQGGGHTMFICDGDDTNCGMTDDAIWVLAD